MERFKLLVYEIDQWWTLFEKIITNIEMPPRDLACLEFHLIVARQINDNLWDYPKNAQFALNVGLLVSSETFSGLSQAML